MNGSDAVINLTNNPQECENTYVETFLRGAENITLSCKELEIEKLIHFSCLGTDLLHHSLYGDIKFRGEDMVYANFPNVTIIKTGLILGGENNKFIEKLSRLSSLFPVFLPVPATKTKIQPVLIDDVTEAVLKILQSEDKKYYEKTFELGGPDVFTIKDFVKKILLQGKNKFIIPIHFILGDIYFGIVQFLPNPFIVREQFHMLKTDMIVDNVKRKVLTFEDLDIKPFEIDH